MRCVEQLADRRLLSTGRTIVRLNGTRDDVTEVFWSISVCDVEGVARGVNITRREHVGWWCATVSSYYKRADHKDAN